MFMKKPPRIYQLNIAWIFHEIVSNRWGKRAAHNRAQIVYYMAENLELRRGEVAREIVQMTGQSLEEAQNEVDLSIQRLFYWGAYADKYGGTVQVCALLKLFWLILF